MRGGAAIKIRATFLVDPLHMRGDVQFAGSANELTRVVGLVGAHRDAFGAPLLLPVQDQQSGIAHGMSVRSSGHGGNDQAVAVLHQCMARICQLQLLA